MRLRVHSAEPLGAYSAGGNAGSGNDGRKMVQFDPKLIVCQIVALQSFFYVVMGVFLGSFR